VSVVAEQVGAVRRGIAGGPQPPAGERLQVVLSEVFSGHLARITAPQRQREYLISRLKLLYFLQLYLIRESK
jgi:hypothetical protein